MNWVHGSLLSSLLALGACSAAPRAEPDWHSVEFAFGPQDLPEDSWAPLDARVRGALTYSVRGREWPCGVELGIQFARAESKDDTVTSGADFIDLRVGAAWAWLASDWLRLVCGAGPRIGMVTATRPGMFAEVSDDDAGLGIYAHAGVFVRVRGMFSIGLDGQWTDGSDYDVLGASRDAAATELLLALRWNF